MFVRQVLLHIEHEPDHVRPGPVGQPAKQEADFVADAAEIGHDDRVLRKMPSQRCRCEYGAARPTSMKHGSTGVRTPGDALQRQSRIAPLNQFSPGGIQDRVLQPDAAPHLSDRESMDRKSQPKRYIQCLEFGAWLPQPLQCRLRE